MNQADLIRQSALENYIQPARAAGQSDVIIRAGDLHRDMKLANAMPAVCSALRSRKFEEYAGVTRLAVTGPANGANVYFHFDVAVGAEMPAILRAPSGEASPPPARVLRSTTESVDLTNAVVLVSCVKSKLAHAAPARMLYNSDWFTKARSVIEAQNARWFILSALYGLVPADREIAPYERTLNAMGVADRRAWAAGVFRQLEPELKECKRVVFFAGLNYREFLVGPLQTGGWQVEVPMEGLAIGEQLAWLSARQ